MSKTQLRISPNHKTGFAVNRTIFNEQSVKSISDEEQNYDINHLTNGEISLQDKRRNIFQEAHHSYLSSPKRSLIPKGSNTGLGLQKRNMGPFRTPMARRNDSISDLASQLSQNFNPRNGMIPFLQTGPRFTKFGVQSKPYFILMLCRLQEWHNTRGR